MSNDQALNYSNYLKVDELLSLQQPLSDGPEHDELLFIIIHQTYELWFKELIHEFAASQVALESADTHRALSILGRIRTILKICVAQIDILETMTPLQFNSFRSRLGESSDSNRHSFAKLKQFLVDATNERRHIYYLKIEIELSAGWPLVLFGIQFSAMSTSADTKSPIRY